MNSRGTSTDESHPGRWTALSFITGVLSLIFIFLGFSGGGAYMFLTAIVMFVITYLLSLRAEREGEFD